MASTRPDAQVLDFARAVADLSGDRVRLLRLVLGNVRTATVTVAWIARLPKVSLALPAGAAAEAMVRPLRRRSLGIPTGRLARAVLELPTDGSYRLGRQRQALRTNVRRAQRTGVTVREVLGPNEWAALHAFMQDRGIAEERYAEFVEPSLASATTVLAAWSGDRVIGYSAILMCGAWAWLRGAQAAYSDEGSCARWMLHAETVDLAVARGARHLLVESAIGLPAGLQYFQQLTGFHAVNLRLRLAEPSGRGD